MSEAVNAAFRAWWDSVARQGDPLRRPRLTNEAFEAGYRAASGDLLTVRDQFAMHALNGLLAAVDDKTDMEPDYVCVAAYVWADKMLKARRA